jgi:hypothetical protein
MTTDVAFSVAWLLGVITAAVVIGWGIVECACHTGTW